MKSNSASGKTSVSGDLRKNYKILKNFTIKAEVQNLFDKNYMQLPPKEQQLTHADEIYVQE